jgi:hypothetical protein
MVSMGCAALLALTAAALPARASEAVRAELNGLAAKLKAVVDEQKADGLTVRELLGPPRLGSSGPGLQEEIIQALKAQEVRVKEDAALYVQGQYALVPDPKDKDGERSMIRLEVTVRSALGAKVIDLQADIRDNNAIVAITGPTVNLQQKVKANAGDRNKAIKEALVRPSVFREGSKVKATKDALYSVEVLVDGRARQPEDVKGQAFVALDKGEVFVVKVTNGSPYEAAVALTLDGLSAFTFSKDRKEKTGAPRYTYFLVGAGKSLLIKGWFRDREESLSFKVVDFKDSALAKAGRDANMLRNDPKVGTLTACFHVAWSGEKPPETREVGSPPRIGFGPGVKTKFTEVKRSIGVLREAVSIRYRKSK